MTAVLEGRGLRYALGGTEIIRGIDVAVHAGERVALTGPSGSGKTTLMSLLSGLVRPSAGSVLLHGQPVADPGAAARRRIGVVFQGYALVSLLTAAENVELACVVADVPADEAADRAEDALAAVGLAERSGHLVEELSGGQQQRVALARALATRPDVLLADEPTAEQDPAHRALALDATLRYATTGAAVLLATHDADVARRCDRRLHVVDGTLAELEPLA